MPNDGIMFHYKYDWGVCIMKEANKVAKALILILQIGITMLVSIGLCGGIGYYVDNRFGTQLMIFFVAFGVISGYSGVYSLIRQYIDLKSSHDRYEQMFDEWERDTEEQTGAEGDDDDDDDEVEA